MVPVLWAAAVQSAWNVSDVNLMFVHVPKTGGSSVSGIVRRIGDAYGHCGVRVQHAVIGAEPCVWIYHESIGSIMRQRTGTPEKGVFTFTWLRDVRTRCLSEFYHYKMSYNKLNGSVEDKLRFIFGPSCRNRQHSFLYRKEGPGLVYDFIGLRERFSESVAVLSHLLDVPVSLFVHLPAKNSSAKQTMVTHPSLSSEPLPVQAAINSGRFRQRNDNDYALYDRANAALDAALESMPTVRKRIRDYTVLQAMATDLCADRPHPCYWSDQGCGYECISALHPPA